jgi:hypothetical protein
VLAAGNGVRTEAWRRELLMLISSRATIAVLL